MCALHLSTLEMVTLSLFPTQSPQFEAKTGKLSANELFQPVASVDMQNLIRVQFQGRNPTPPEQIDGLRQVHHEFQGRGGCPSVPCCNLALPSPKGSPLIGICCPVNDDSTSIDLPSFSPGTLFFGPIMLTGLLASVISVLSHTKQGRMVLSHTCIYYFHLSNHQGTIQFTAAWLIAMCPISVLFPDPLSNSPEQSGAAA